MRTSAWLIQPVWTEMSEAVEALAKGVPGSSSFRKHQGGVGGLGTHRLRAGHAARVDVDNEAPIPPIGVNRCPRHPQAIRGGCTVLTKNQIRGPRRCCIGNVVRTV
jgi:hypothetical protein